MLASKKRYVVTVTTADQRDTKKDKAGTLPAKGKKNGNHEVAGSNKSATLGKTKMNSITNGENVKKEKFWNQKKDSIVDDKNGKEPAFEKQTIDSAVGKNGRAATFGNQKMNSISDGGNAKKEKFWNRKKDSTVDDKNGTEEAFEKQTMDSTVGKNGRAATFGNQKMNSITDDKNDKASTLWKRSLDSNDIEIGKSATLRNQKTDSTDGGNSYLATVLSVKKCWKTMCNGTFMTKISIRSGKINAKKRFVKLDENLLGIRYRPTRKKNGFRVPLKDIKVILTNDRLPDDGTFSSYSRDCCLAITYMTEEGTGELLRLVAPSKDAVREWRFGLRNLIIRKGILLSRPDPLRDEWLQEAFEQHDVEKNGALSMDEVNKLLNSLNIFLDQSTLIRFFDQANVDGPQGRKEGKLTKEEFAVFFKNISTRKEIVDILNQYSATKQSLTVNELTEFLKANEGGNHDDETKGYEVIEKYEPVGVFRRELLLGLDGFRNFMLCPDNDVFNPKHKDIYQDMNQPLSNYFISSSHNTYLQQDQLRGPSSVDAYISALKRGCRCVELDCWDGDKKEPIIYHGHTLTSKILFKDVIEAIREHAFTASKYPVILSFENHCSVEQQTVMATYLRDILGDMLCCDEILDDQNQLPSPEALKGKILIKGKKLPPTKDDGDCELSEEEEDGNDYQSMINRTEIATTNSEVTKTTNGEINKEAKISNVDSPGDTGTEKKAESKKKKKLKIAKELSDLVSYVQSVSFGSFEKSLESQNCCQMSSFGENKFSNLGEKQPQKFIEYNRKFLSRTYPAGKRVDSSNYNPMTAWIVGCQLVALNFQTNGPMMDLYRGRFIDNGGCGYVLKPECLLQDEFNPQCKEFDFEPMTIDLKIYSGQQLPKPKASKEKSVIDPYVRIDVYGIPVDTKPKVFVTTAIPNNGFNPVWDEACKIKLQAPELALLRFIVYDNDVGSDTFVAQFTLPVSSLKSGYRHVFLTNFAGEPIPHASLFIHVSIS